MKKVLILGIAGLLAVASAAYAYPTLAGPTGNAVLPTAAVAAAGELNLAADYYNTDDDSTIPVRLTYGIAENFEVGVGYTLLEDANSWNVNAKYLTPLTPLGFDWSLGARYATADVEALTVDVKTTSVYFVGTRAFELGDAAPALNGTVGVNWTQVKDGTSENAFRFFVAGDLTLGNRLSLAAEFQTRSSSLESDALYAFTARYPLTNQFAAQVGYTNVNPVTGVTGTGDANIFAGLNISFGRTAE